MQTQVHRSFVSPLTFVVTTLGLLGGTLHAQIVEEVWRVEGTQSGAGFGHAVAGAGDVNGDGFEDVLVGVPFHDGGGGAVAEAGRVLLYCGSSSGPGTSPDWTFEGARSRGHMGFSLAGVGDVDGDGYDDFVVGAPDTNALVPGSFGPRPALAPLPPERGRGPGSQGLVAFFRGSASGPASTPAWVAIGREVNEHFGVSVAGAGDVNADGHADVLVGATGTGGGRGGLFLFLGGNGGPAPVPSAIFLGDQLSSAFGASVAGVGDVDGDGLDDVVVGAPAYDDVYPDVGRAYLYHGAPSGLSALPTLIEPSGGPIYGARFGTHVAPAGDNDADGFADFLVGAPEAGSFPSDEGYFFWYAGGLLIPDRITRVEGVLNTGHLGSAMTGVGDLTGDGLDDVAAGLPRYEPFNHPGGRLQLHLGHALGIEKTPIEIHPAAHSGARLGWSVSPAGDVDGDGRIEVLVSAPGMDGTGSAVGAVLLFERTDTQPEPLDATPDWTSSVPFAFTLGEVVANAGDVNGDGYEDALLAYPEDLNWRTTHFHAGGPTGLEAITSWTYSIYTAFVKDMTLAGNGDFDGDGFDDFAVGYAGEVHAFLGAAGGPGDVPDWVVDEGGSFGLGLAGPGDVNADGYDDLAVGDPDYGDFGRALLYLGSATGLETTPAWVLEGAVSFGRLGAAVERAGDVNGDGKLDLLVGEPRDGTPPEDAPGVHLFLGTSTGLAYTPHWSVNAGRFDKTFGLVLAGEVDVDGDGLLDVLVGEPEYQEDETFEGRVLLYRGIPGSFEQTPTWTIQSQSNSMYMAGAVEGLGDLDQDGDDEFVVVSAAWRVQRRDEGLARIFLGAPAPRTNAAWRSEGGDMNAGISSAARGDFNGDGHPDLLLGVPGGDDRARLFLGPAF